MRLPFRIKSLAIQGNFDKLVSERDDLVARLDVLETADISDSGSALSAVSTVDNATYAAWTAGPTITIPTTGTWDVWSGPVLIQRQDGNVAAASGRFRLYRLRGGVDTAVGRAVFFANGTPAAHGQFGGASLQAFDTLAFLVGDVLTYRYATSALTHTFSFGALGVSMWARRRT